MAQVIELELPSGKKVYAEAQTTAGFRELAASKTVERKLADLAAELRESLTVIAGALDNLTPRAPDKIAVELSAEIGSGGAIKLFAADAKAGLKISLTWETKK